VKSPRRLETRLHQGRVPKADYCICTASVQYCLYTINTEARSNPYSDSCQGGRKRAGGPEGGLDENTAQTMTATQTRQRLSTFTTDC
jgi:hypothetical protein